MLLPVTLWIFIPYAVAKVKKCVVGTSPSLKWKKVDEAVCRFQLIYDTLECNDKYTIRYSDAQNVIPGVETEMVGSSCQFSEQSVDCLCLGSGCNRPNNIKNIFITQIGRTNSLSKLQSMLCFLTDGDLYGNKTSTSSSPPLATVQDKDESSNEKEQLNFVRMMINNTQQTRADYFEDTTTELETTKKTRRWIVFTHGGRQTTMKGAKHEATQSTASFTVAKNNYSVDEDDADASQSAKAVQSELKKQKTIYVVKKSNVAPIMLYVLFGLLLLLLFCANIVFFTLVFVYMRKEGEERSKAFKHDIGALSKSESV